ncbi:hypothetical protein J4E85_003737 [Alternaria conjuncta]|uniref:uncharacterized protein n=1 Tax=Alternaria conjuncta TaxID=181017 RepID=UPI00221F1EE7|nr:uncharacterized protein J4E85_003737 [Alternaria conjuncta]KAI4931148.1 hypothetical protein J4E85_003737 [Alternaria conjuncta]
MSDDSWDDDDRRHDSRRKTKDRRVKNEKNFLETLMDSSIENSMNKPLFQAIKVWIDCNIGIDLTYLVWAIALCIPARTYGKATYDWLSSNLTNSLELDSSDALVTDLLMWISKQPSNQLFAWLPTFEHLEWKDLSHEQKTANNDESNSHHLIASAGYTPFFHEGVPFLLYKPDGRTYDKLTLRCMWGSKKPIEALLKAVHKTVSGQMTSLTVLYVSAHRNVNHTSRKRSLETIDMNPLKKQELLTDLQVFFADGTEDYYYQNGTPYRRGYLFYGPAGTGKTSLSTAIASHYNLPLCVIDLAGMDDTILQNDVKNLPARCVILFEDIDAAGIVRERTMALPPLEEQEDSDEDEEEEEEGESSSESISSWNARPKKKKRKNVDSRKKKLPPPPPPPSRTKVTLSGLLNTLDGPGSREGHIVILTTNAPDSLDEALYRPGRVDTQVYLGFADDITAGITFTRIFGSDKQVTVPRKELNRMGRRFGRMVPSDFFTPAEIQKFCMNRRGQPQKALNEFPQFIDEKRTGKTNFKYDIHRRAPQPTFQKKEDIRDDDSSGEGQETPSSTDGSVEDVKQLEPGSPHAPSTKLPSPARQRKRAIEQLHITHSRYPHEDDALAYGDYHPRRGQRVWEDRLADSVADACQEIKGFFTESRHPSHVNSLRANRIEEMTMPNFEPRMTAPSPLTQSNLDAMSLDEPPAASPSPIDLRDSSVYYTPLSVGEQIEKTFQHHRRPSHSDVDGRRNAYPHHGPLTGVAEGNAWEDEVSPAPNTVSLRNLDPQPLEDFEQRWK